MSFLAGLFKRDGDLTDKYPEKITPPEWGQASHDVSGRPFTARAQTPRSKRSGRHDMPFSEASLMDSGLSRSATMDFPSSVTPMESEEFQDLDLHSRMSEEVLLNKLQELQMQLADLRERKNFVGGSQQTLAHPESLKGHLLIATHKIPVPTAMKDREARVANNLVGLVPAFKQLRRSMSLRWFGIPSGGKGQESTDKEIKMDDYTYIPLYLDEADQEQHHVFCNSVLWPLFHSLPLSIERAKTFHTSVFHAYERVNQAFADAMLADYREGDIFWIHDFQLMLVPKMIRARLPDAKIGFFLHTPFPSGEIYRILPVRKELLEGLLGADLVGFHTYDYARQFLNLCSKILSLEISPNRVDYEGMAVKVGTFPMGIDADVFIKALESKAVRSKTEILIEQFAGKKVVLGVDRFDYIKGLPHKLLAMEHFLTVHPDWVNKVLLLQIAMPSPSQDVDYDDFRAEIYETVGRINGRFASMEDMPIHFRELSLSFEDLCALYSLADVALITSLRDGMNLVSYEFTICQAQKCGVLILSEFTGAAQSLPGALLCNPWNVTEVADALYQALRMTELEKRIKHHKLHTYIMMNSSENWGQTFLRELLKACAERREVQARLSPLNIRNVQSMYSRAARRLIALDYDGTLARYETDPDLASPEKLVLDVLSRLMLDKRNYVFIVTGRDFETAEKWLRGTGVGLVTEHAYKILWPGERELYIRDDDNKRDDSVKAALDKAIKILNQFVDHNIGSYLSVKERSVTYHFRNVDADYGYSQAQEARAYLDKELAGTNMDVVSGNKILYVRPRGANKGTAIRHIVKRMQKEGDPPDFILSIGDDRSDEDMFAAIDEIEKTIKADVITCTVGRKSTRAHSFVEDVDAVISTLKRITSPNVEPNTA